MIPQIDASGWIVLIVDDEKDNLGIPEQLLTYLGATVHTAMNGLEGLDVLKTITPSFVLLDLSMPEMDGWTMLKHIREDERLKNIPVIALTAHAMAGDKERVMAAGFNGYITKPFLITTFFEGIKESLKLSEQSTNGHSNGRPQSAPDEE